MADSRWWTPVSVSRVVSHTATAALLVLAAGPARGQVREPVSPDIVSAPATAASSTGAKRPSVEAGAVALRVAQEALRPRDEVVIDVPAMTIDGRAIVQLRNKWLTVAFPAVPRSRSGKASSVEFATVEELLTSAGPLASLARQDLASRAAVNKTLREKFSLSLEDVYSPPNPPFYSDGRGIECDRTSGECFLQIVRAIDREKNECEINLISLATAEVIWTSPALCWIE